MAGFLYYLPKFQGTPKVERLREMGLGYAFDCQTCQPRGCDTGPDNEGGQVVAHQSFPPELLGYFRDRQKWRKIPRSEIWVGMYTDEHRPKPKDLAREQQISGRFVELEDGNQWLLPIARRWQEFGSELRWNYNLPTRLTLNGDADWHIGGVLPRYERLWQLAMAYEDAFHHALASKEVDETERVTFEFPEVDILVIEAFKANYRIDSAEMDLLAIYDQRVRNMACEILLDAQTQLDWIKKKVSAVGDGSSL